MDDIIYPDPRRSDMQATTTIYIRVLRKYSDLKRKQYYEEYVTCLSTYRVKGSLKLRQTAADSGNRFTVNQRCGVIMQDTHI